MKRNLHTAMRANDLAELYAGLELFGKTYDDCAAELEALRSSIIFLYMKDYTSTGNLEDAASQLKAYKNPRGAGRSKKHMPEKDAEVSALRQKGLSIRDIGKISGLSRSTVQRILSSKK